MSTALQFDKLVMGYGQHRVLEGVDLAIDPNEYIGLVGVNGAGKTTLIKGLLDFCEIDGGGIEIFGVSHKKTEARARLAFLPERFVPPQFLTGREFLRCMTRLYGSELRPARIERVLTDLDLDPTVLSKPVRDLSKGMAQKLGLAACLLSGKDLFVLDEPMSGLDPKARAILKRYLRKLKEQGHTVFFSTHLLADVETLCDRMAVLHDGHVSYFGSPQAFRARYGTDTMEEAYLKCVGYGPQ